MTWLLLSLGQLLLACTQLLLLVYVRRATSPVRINFLVDHRCTHAMPIAAAVSGELDRRRTFSS